MMLRIESSMLICHGFILDVWYFLDGDDRVLMSQTMTLNVEQWRTLHNILKAGVNQCPGEMILHLPNDAEVEEKIRRRSVEVPIGNSIPNEAGSGPV